MHIFSMGIAKRKKDKNVTIGKIPKAE